MKLLKILIVIVCMLVCIFQAFSSGGEEDKDDIYIFDGRISYADGDVYLNGKEAEIGDSVNNSDLVETGTDSVCEIIFNERNIIQLGPGSLFEVGSSRKIDFSLEKGSLSAVADKLNMIAGTKERLAVRTPSAVIGVRGTLFFVKVEDENNSYLCICNGTANTYKGDGRSRIKIKADHHKAVRFTRSGDSYKRSSAGLLYHDDESMEKLAEKINVRVDWGSGKAY